jgi:hypothetical protein
MQYWFYVRTSGLTSTGDDGKKVTHYPLASIVGPMKPSTQMPPSSEVSTEREACNGAFALACRYSGGQDLVEEMVASKCWPLGRNRPSMRIEMVNLPVFGEDVGVLFPCFDIKLAEDETAEDFTAVVEWEAREILDEMSDEEYLAQRAIVGTMPCLNCVFDELGIHHEEHEVPAKVLKSLEDKEKKVALKNTTATAEAKKRKGIGRAKAISKKQKVGAASTAASVGSGEEMT